MAFKTIVYMFEDGHASVMCVFILLLDYLASRNWRPMYTT
jgi:hypothetical protein